MSRTFASANQSANGTEITPCEQPKEESPNLTGTAVKSNAEINDSGVKFYGSKKRLFGSCEETIGSPVATTR